MASLPGCIHPGGVAHEGIANAEPTEFLETMRLLGWTYADLWVEYRKAGGCQGVRALVAWVRGEVEPSREDRAALTTALHGALNYYGVERTSRRAPHT
jgi:hypothetical protein